ncbi:hypothetical protein WUBG_13939, partial [Wuchereria bancrofti]
RFAPDVSADEMAYTAELAERMANFVLEDECKKECSDHECKLQN